MTDDTIIERLYKPESRPDPYPLLAELRRSPVSWQKGGWSPNGSWVVSSYHATSALLRDPRISQDSRPIDGDPEKRTLPGLSFIELDPPEHDRVRTLTQRHFGPPARPGFVNGLRPEIELSVAKLIDDMKGKGEVDVVAGLSYALPVKLVSGIIGVPFEDQPQFQKWLDAFVVSDEAPETRAPALKDLQDYMAKLVEQHRAKPGDDLISRMATDTGPDGHLEDPYIVSTAVLLLIGGHETTANLISNGMLLFLREPDVARRIREQPEFVVSVVEELLRFEPPVQMLIRRRAIDEINIEGATIPKGANVTLANAAANRDPKRFPDPDRFDAERPENAHLGFGSGVHYCFGAPLARLEVQTALRALAQRLEAPKLARDPAYRPSAVLRGMSELHVEMSGVRN